jgi:ABC-type transporter Mla subunit MlaD
VSDKITKKATEIGKNVNENVRDNLDDVRKQLLAYENQIKEYLGKVNASIDTYKFSVEKHGDGITDAPKDLMIYFVLTQFIALFLNK